MLKIYNVSYEYRVNDEDWVKCGFSDWAVGDDSETPESILLVDTEDLKWMWYKMRGCGNSYRACQR